MGLLDKLLGGVVLPPTTRTRTSTGSAAHRPAAPGSKGTHPADRPVNPMRQTPIKPKPEETPAESVERSQAAAAAPVEPVKSVEPIAEPPTESMASFSAKPAAGSSLSAEDILAELFSEPEKESAQAASVPAEASGGSLLETKGSMGSFTAEPVSASVATVPATEEITIPTAPTSAVSEPTEAVDTPTPWSDVTQRKLDRYFARMRQAYPDGVIVRLNTGQKKLAERGAQLRREIGMEGRLDEFFALGEFTYRRSEGGRPSVVKTDRQQEGLLRDLQAAFPQGVPSVAAVQQADHRLYLNLRAAARRDQCTMTDYLKRHELLKKKECVS